MSSLKTPPIVSRPQFASWLFLRMIANGEAGKALGVGPEQVRRYCLPFGNELRAVPPPKVMARIVAWTGGAVQPGDFYEPVIDKPADEDWTEGGRFLEVEEAV